MKALRGWHKASLIAQLKSRGAWVSVGIIVASAVKLAGYDPGEAGYAIVSLIGLSVGPLLGWYLSLLELRILLARGVVSSKQYAELRSQHIQKRFPLPPPSVRCFKVQIETDGATFTGRATVHEDGEILVSGPLEARIPGVERGELNGRKAQNIAEDLLIALVSKHAASSPRAAP